ncbi:MAG: hypothetical protein AB7G17_06920 [Phycisphaerales bacterium]
MIAAGGVALAAWQLWPAGVRRAPPETAQAAVIPLPQFSLNVNPEMETQVSRENAMEIASRIKDRVAHQFRERPELSGLGVKARESLLHAVQEQMEIYLAGSYEKYLAFQERSGGRREFVERAAPGPDRESAERTVREVWDIMSSTIALHPVSLEEVTARVRYKNGEERPVSDDRHVATIVTMPDRWPALSGEPAANRYTIVEVMLPVFYLRSVDGDQPVAGPVYFAIWFVWDAAASDWRIHQTRLYNPLRIGNLVCPQF